MDKDFAINALNLSKSFVVKEKTAGLLGSIRSIFKSNNKEIKAVDNISLKIKSGEMIGFIGPNGAGKTTTLKMLSGILYPSCGSIDVLGFRPFDRKNEFLKKISLVMGQKNQMMWDLPAIDSFLLNKETYEISDKDYKNIFEELVEIFEIKEILNQQVRRLSLGQRMKCEMVASLLHNPKILFLDEPTIGLDIIIQKKLRQFIKKFNKKFGTTVILTSHYMDDVKEIADRIIIINQGKILFDDKINSLSKKYADYRILSLVLNEEASKNTLKSFDEIIKYDFPELVIKVKPEKIAEMTSFALKELNVDDIKISEPELEDIVSKLFDKG